MLNIEKEKYQQALDFLFAQLPMFSRVGAAAYKPGLDRVRHLSHFFNNPEKKFKSIHIAGTNGKGSTSHLIAAILQAQGYKTALYTSPHLVDFRERIKINGEMIPENKVVEFVEKWTKDDYNGDKPSFFELTMMMAFDWFAEERVDYAVIETGMGGRLDSTNIITPLLSIITNISYDHTQFLGDTLEKIAGEKAGIIKEGIPVIIGEATPEEEVVFHTVAAEKHAPIVDVYRNSPASRFELKEDYSGWRAFSPIIGEFETDLAGDYQKKNICTVLSAVENLRSQDIYISDDAIKTGLSKGATMTGLRGRWEIIGRNPLTICDTGHNFGGLQINMRRLRNLMEQKEKTAKLHILAGFVADKDIEIILTLFPKNAVYYLTQADIPRALPGEKLKEKFIAAGLNGNVFPDVRTAWEQIQKEAKSKDIIYIGGSTFIVADFLKSCF